MSIIFIQSTGISNAKRSPIVQFQYNQRKLWPQRSIDKGRTYSSPKKGKNLKHDSQPHLGQSKVIENCQHALNKFSWGNRWVWGWRTLKDVIYFESKKASDATSHGIPCTKLGKYQLWGVWKSAQTATLKGLCQWLKNLTEMHLDSLQETILGSYSSASSPMTWKQRQKALTPVCSWYQPRRPGSGYSVREQRCYSKVLNTLEDWAEESHDSEQRQLWSPASGTE